MNLSQTAQFKKDIKRQLRQGKDQTKLIAIVQTLLDGKDLPPKHRNHPYDYCNCTTSTICDEY